MRQARRKRETNTRWACDNRKAYELVKTQDELERGKHEVKVHEANVRVNVRWVRGQREPKTRWTQGEPEANPR